MTAERMDPEPAHESHPSEPDRPAVEPAVAAVRDLCPFLLAADGAWRGVEANSDHRCTAVYPPARLATEKQRRLCLTADHETCATFVAALAAREPAGHDPDVAAAAAVPVDRVGRPMPRTTPVVMERGRFGLIPAHSLRPDRSAGQAGLVLLLVLAFVGILIARPGADEGGAPGAAVDPTATPAASAAVASPVASQVVVAPTATPAAEASPTPAITLVPTEVTPAPSQAPDTYTVKRGDTLSGIASVYGTTWQVLAELNDIENPSAMKVGTVLQLP